MPGCHKVVLALLQLLLVPTGRSGDGVSESQFTQVQNLEDSELLKSLRPHATIVDSASRTKEFVYSLEVHDQSSQRYEMEHTAEERRTSPQQSTSGCSARRSTCSKVLWVYVRFVVLSMVNGCVYAICWCSQW
nr:uncharacterized protein LOC120973243 [Aegilops tauschii subsp. strangulata]XP_045088838.1 uncharacterized protein LOC120973243 [Aegilops tauschii subsp. strangulata]